MPSSARFGASRPRASELDLMGRIAGLELQHRWAKWQREPFTAYSRSHVSVWAKP